MYGWHNGGVTSNGKHVAMFYNNGSITDSKIFETIKQLTSFLTEWKNRIINSSN